MPNSGGLGGMSTVDVTEFLRECSREPWDAALPSKVKA